MSQFDQFGQFQVGSSAPVPGTREPVPGSRPDYPPAAAPPQAAASPVNDPMAMLTLALQRIDQLEQQLRQQAAGVGADIPKLAGPTHDLYLADGTHVEGTGAIPTHIDLGDRVVPVAWAVAR